jgi:hypothetical protein
MKRNDVLLLICEKIVFAIIGGFLLWLMPALQHWLVYLVWSPVMSVAFAWAYSCVLDIASENPQWKPAIGRGLIIGITHLIATSVVWALVKTAIPRLH